MKKTVLILSSVFALSLSATTNNVETQQVANKVVVSSTSVDNLDMVAKGKIDRVAKGKIDRVAKGKIDRVAKGKIDRVAKGKIDRKL